MAIDWYSLHETIWAMSGTYALLACIVSIVLAYQHLRNFTAPRLQKPIVRIILMVPVGSPSCSPPLLSLIVGDSDLLHRFVDISYIL